MKTSSTKKKSKRADAESAKTWDERTFEERIRHAAVGQSDDHPVSGTLAAAAADLRVAILAIDFEGDNDDIVNSLLRIAMRIEAAQAETHRLEHAASKAVSP